MIAKTHTSGSLRAVYALSRALAVIFFVTGFGLFCGPEKKKPVEICALQANKSLFLCDVSAREAPEDCRPDAIGDSTRRRFLLQMTTVNIETLYLDGSAGSRGPFAFNDTAAVLAAMGVELCRVREGKCSCRMTYRRPRLDELFRDAATCAANSEFQDDPLFFRGRGCRR